MNNFYTGAYHHVMNRGDDGTDIFAGNIHKNQVLNYLEIKYSSLAPCFLTPEITKKYQKKSTTFSRNSPEQALPDLPKLEFHSMGRGLQLISKNEIIRF
jgi:hypothetical protein